MIVNIFIIAICILITGYLTCAEFSIISVNRNKIKLKAEEGHKIAILLDKALEDVNAFLPSIAVIYTIIGIFVGAYSSYVFSEPITIWISHYTIVDNFLSEQFIETFVVIILTIVISFFTIVFAELLPKRLALAKSETISLICIRPILFLVRLLRPVSFILTKTCNFVAKIIRIPDKEKNEEGTEEEIRMLVDIGGEEGRIEAEEVQMINNVFEFSGTIAEEIVTHRTDIVSLNIECSREEFLHAISEQFSRIPVYEGSIDNIIGVLHVKDIMHYVIEKGINIKKDIIDIVPLLKEPYFVPSSKKANELFHEMQKVKTQLAIVIDEYGGTFGIVTMEDLIEEIMGNIFDEYDEEEIAEIEQIDENTLLVSGIATVEEINELLELELSTEEYDTIGGFVIGELGRIPTDDETEFEVIFENVVFKIKNVYEKRIQQLLIKKIEPISDDVIGEEDID